MRNLLICISFGIALLLGGCAGTAGYRMEPGYSPHYSGGYAGYGGTDGSVRTTACQPYRADTLMSWAKELDSNKSHSRGADVNVRNDRVDCTSRESAASQMGQKK